MSRKKLYAFGDSLTDKYFISEQYPNVDTTFPKWPELVANNVGMDCDNYGESGSSNFSIIRNFTEVLAEKDDIGVIIILWTSPLRHDFALKTFKPNLYSGRARRRAKPEYHQNIETAYWQAIHANENILAEIYTLFFKQVQTIHALCAKLKIPIISAKGFNIDGSMDGFSKNFVYKISKIWHDCIMSDTSESFNQNQIIGWPFIKDFGGSNMIQMLEDRFPVEKFQVGNHDPHPNAFGHEFIAEQFIDRYSLLYK